MVHAMPDARRTRPIHRFALLVVSLVLLCLNGCLIVDDHLSLNPDGSGTVMLRTMLPGESDVLEAVRMGSGQAGAAEASYPPLTEEDAQTLFPGEGFEIEASVESGGQDQPDVHVVAVQFDDVNNLLNSPYASVHQLEMKIVEDKLVVRAREALRGVPAIAEVEIPEGQLPMPIDLEAARNAGEQFASTFRLTLPNDITAADAQVNGSTATWSVAASKDKPLKELGPALNSIRKATCSAQGLSFTPQTPVRLGLDSLKELAAGQVGPDAVEVDQQAVLAAAGVQPLRVQVVRTFDLTGDSWADDGCQLVVGLALPAQIKPLAWKPAELTVAEDDLGTDLKPVESDDRFSRGPHMMGGMFRESEDDQARHVFHLELALPDSQAKALRKVAGQVEAQYPGATQVIKIDQAVSANHIMQVDPANPASAMMSVPTAMPIENAQLQERGIEMVVQQAMRITGMTMLMISIESEEAKMGQIQVFDHQGQSWPSITANPFGGGGMGHQMAQVIVLGKPQPPLSLAMTVQTGGQTVAIPFEFANLSLLPDEPESDESAQTDDQPAE